MILMASSIECPFSIKATAPARGALCSPAPQQINNLLSKPDNIDCSSLVNFSKNSFDFGSQSSYTGIQCTDISSKFIRISFDLRSALKSMIWLYPSDNNRPNAGSDFGAAPIAKLSFNGEASG